MIQRFILVSILFMFSRNAFAEEAKDPRYQTITQTELAQKIRMTPIESSEHERLIVRANYSGLRKYAYDQYKTVWSHKRDNAYANLYFGMVALDSWAAANTRTTTVEQLAWLQSAGTCLTTAHDLNAEDAEITIEYGYFSWKYANNGDMGIKLMKDAANKRADDARVHRLLGSVYANPGSRYFNPKEAESELHKAIRIDPYYAGPHGELYHLYYNTKRYEEAEQEVQLFKALVPKQVAESNEMTSYEKMIRQAITQMRH